MKAHITLKAVALVVFGTSALVGEEPDTLRLSLQEAVVMALERNPAFAIQRLRPSIMEAALAEQRAAFEPNLTASVSRDKSHTQRFLGARPEPFEMTSQRTQYGAGVTQVLPTGTILAVDAAMSGSTSSIYLPQYSGNVGVTVTQPLLRGFGLGANLIGVRSAQIDLDISRYELQAMAERLVQDVEASYWGLYLAEQELAIQEQSLQLALQQLQESQERVAVGKLAELELASVRAEVARRKGAVIDAQTRYEQARIDLIYLLNPGPGVTWSTTPALLDHPTIMPDSLGPIQAHEELAMRYRPDLAQARLSLRRGQLQVAYTRNGLLPRLDVFVTFGRTSYARTFKEAAPDIESPFYSVNAGVNFQFPLIDAKARAQVGKAIKSREQLRLALQNMERLVQRDVRVAYADVVRTRQQIEASREARILQEKNLEAEMEKFRVGRSTNLLVLQVQRDLTSSRLNEVRAAVDYLKALTALHVMEGTLLVRRAIQLPDEP
ncbi:MAG: TolC family protein [candidate division KSB1 bacterium]|nr:TolC family protein [candidate division KSB1 bacterium]